MPDTPRRRLPTVLPTLAAMALIMLVAPACGPSTTELIAAFQQRGWVYDGAPRNGSAFTARGTVQGRAFTVDGRAARGKSSGATTTVSIDTETGTSRVIVTNAVPDFLKLDSQLAGFLLPTFPVPPRWTGTPAALQGKWDVYATPDDGQRWVTQELVERLNTLPQMDRPPYLIVADGKSVLMAAGIVWTEAQIVQLIETAAAPGRTAGAPTSP